MEKKIESFKGFVDTLEGDELKIGKKKIGLIEKLTQEYNASLEELKFFSANMKPDNPILARKEKSISEKREEIEKLLSWKPGVKGKKAPSDIRIKILDSFGVDGKKKIGIWKGDILRTDGPIDYDHLVKILTDGGYLVAPADITTPSKWKGNKFMETENNLVSLIVPPQTVRDFLNK